MSTKLQELYEQYKRLIPDVDKGHLSYDFRLKEQLRLNDKGDNAQSEDIAEKLAEQLKLFNVTQRHIDMLLDRFISDFSYEDLTKKYGYRNRHETRRAYEAIFESLKDNSTLKFVLKNMRGIDNE